MMMTPLYGSRLLLQFSLLVQFVLLGIHPEHSLAFTHHRSFDRQYHLTVSGSSGLRTVTNYRSGPATSSKSSSSKISASSSTSPSTAGTAAASSSSRQKRVSGLTNWSKDQAGILIGSGLEVSDTPEAGLGLVLKRQISNSDDTLLVTVPADLALSVEVPNGGPDDISIIREAVKDTVEARKTVRSLPWFVQFALYLWHLNNVSSIKSQQGVDLQPWLDTLPPTLETPIHWKSQDRTDWLQYSHMVEAVQRQEQTWKDLHEKLTDCTTSSISWDDFVWGCEMARSRAFSGGYTGSPFNPYVYAFTLVLVTAYVGLNIGTIDQAANGAALVFCSSVLRDFVIPKFFRTKKYVICPVIDCANHKSTPGGTTAKVAYEYFGNSYSLSTTVPTLPADTQIYISYGSRSNDQLLQYYGFVEADNPHDTYVMPPLREWDIAQLEEAVGAPFAPGRLQKLDRAGLLGQSLADVQSSFSSSSSSTSTEDENSLGPDGDDGNPRGGVVLSRVAGIDPAIIQGLRALVSTDQEWQDSGESVGNFAAEVNPENERKARLVARKAIEMELSSKPTTLEEDTELLKRVKSSKKSGMMIQPEEQLALAFRIEKKKLLKETIDKLR